MLDYIFFDLDGTLTDPALGITNSIMYALKKMGREIPPREELYFFIGPPLVKSFMEYCSIDEEEAYDAVKKYREYFSVYGLFENDPYDGVYDSLEKIKSSGKKLCIATSKPEEYTLRILEKFDLLKYFDFVCGASMDEKRSEKADIIKYALETTGCKPDDAIMVGDRLHDIQGAKKCGVRSVGVLWGYGSREELEEAGADYIVNDFSELNDVLHGLE